MTGPEHFNKAEAILEYGDRVGADLSAQQQANIIAAAQVHATLALAAATLEAVEHSDGWEEVLSRWPS